MQAMITSMTPDERSMPDLVINSTSRKRRVIKGSGSTIVELNRLLKQYKQMAKNDEKNGAARDDGLR